MTKQMKRTNPGDVANLIVRNILADASRILGGFTEREWQDTLKYFGGRCAYTGVLLPDGNYERDHAVPINRSHCGLHLYGNVLPATHDANSRKGGAHWRDFIASDSARLAHIEEFVRQTGYQERAERLADLRGFCAMQYTLISDLCARSRAYLEWMASYDPDSTAGEALGEVNLILEENAESEDSPGEKPAKTAGRERLTIELIPPSEPEFKSLLLAKKKAWIATHYTDKRVEVKEWSADNFGLGSSVMGNLRSRSQFRSGAWQDLGIERVIVSIEPPR